MIFHGSNTLWCEIGITKDRAVTRDDRYANVERLGEVVGQANGIVMSGMQIDVGLGKGRRLVELIFDFGLHRLFDAGADEVSQQQSDDTNRATVEKDQAGMESEGHEPHASG